MVPTTVEELTQAMADQDYILSSGLAVSLFLRFASSARCFSRARRVSARPRLQTWRHSSTGV